ncbi:unnamed protein product [Adineta steineri]|uniref:Uncharacterized protein n=1 Tax=Adineta steineri TaxID=433720 RepID=A0A813NG16_9BILA|nr:unnamed protein product [Adineta steineri]CAF1388676.1 unnamed protein product [Adineta steineri]CAF1400689.1 unnamed protein product [Adineta steineri]CAF1610207.1 unnamed protein product [Adineta steineri]CAF3585602.1 unnamed protein product [Adineta steineri]
MHSINSSHRTSGDIPSSMSLRETHIYDINSLSDKDKFKLLSAKALDYIDQHCAVSIRLDGTYIPVELRQLLDHKRPLHLIVTTQDAFSFETFKRCVTTFLSRERECDGSITGQGNWNIIEQGYQTTIITGYVFDGIKGYNVSNFVFENLTYFIRCLRQQYRCMVTLSCESPVVKLSSKLTVAITHESPIIRHLAATYMQKSMMSAVTQCEMYHVNLILHQNISPSIGTPPRLIQPPTLNDTRLVMPTLTQNKWDSISLSDGISSTPICNDPLNLNDILQSVAPNTFGTSSIQSTPSVSHPAMTRQYPSSSITHNLTNTFEQIRLDESRLNQHYLATNLSNNIETVSPTATSGIDDYQHEIRQRRAPVDHASQLGAISDVTDEEEESTAWRVDQRPFYTQIRTLQHRFYSYGIRVGEEYSRITSILNIPPLISITETARERKIGTKKQWYFSLLLDGHLMLAYVWDSKKNDAKRRAYDTMVHLLNTTHEFLIKPVKNNKWKVVKATRQR